MPPAARPHKLHIPRPAAGGRSRPFRCSSSPNCKRFAGLQFGSIWLVRKSMQKETLEADRIVPQATEEPRRRTLRPAHENLSANLNYSAACVETTLPSIAVATQGDGKTRCHAIQKRIYVCASGAEYLRSIVHVCRGRCLHRPAQYAPFLRKSAANSLVPNGPMWASAPTRCSA